jgi:membrane-associated phospholipid phosphatase
MPELHQLEIIVNLFLQDLGKWLTIPMSFFSFLGSEEFYLMVMPFLFWCVSPLLGLRLGLILIFSNATNLVLKLAFHNPRPYWIDARVQALASESSFGIPSNHSQTAMVLWGYAAGLVRKPWALAVSVLVIVLIGISRVYLGVHFLSDLLAGWLFGGLLLLLVPRLETAISAWVQQASLRRLLLTSILASLGLVLAVTLASTLLGSAWQLPPEWVATALAAYPATPITPLNPEGALTLGGTLLGMLAGSAWIYRKTGGYSVAGPLEQKTVRYLLGWLVLFALWYGLGKVFPRDPTLFAYVLRYLRYVLIGAWISLFAPLLFRRLRLMQ